MVKSNLAYKYLEIEEEVDYTYLPEKLKYTSVSLSEIFENKLRFEASAFSIDSKLAKELIQNNKYGFINLVSKNGLIEECYYGGRAKRNYVTKNTDGAIGFLGSAEMLNLYSKPIKFLSSNIVNTKPFEVKQGTILVSRSGTIGKTTFVNETLSKCLVSEHAIRIIAKKNAGYLYAFFQTKIGLTLIKSNTFGAVVDQIEPQHFEKIIIPNAPEKKQVEIHNLITESYRLRDESNQLIDFSEKILYEELKLKNIDDIDVDYLDNTTVRSFSAKLSSIDLRFDSSYNVPIIQKISAAIKVNAKSLIKLSDSSLTSGIILPGRFTRTYVDENNGVQFLGGRDLFRLNPSTEKFLSKIVHKKQIEGDLKISKNDILTPSRGTIGKVVLAPEHFSNKVISDNIINIRPANDSIAGYLFCFLNSEYGSTLIKRQIYGGVVDAMEPQMLANIEIPILKNEYKQKEINDLVLKANKLRFEAHTKEQEAISLMEQIINTTK